METKFPKINKIINSENLIKEIRKELRNQLNQIEVEIEAKDKQQKFDDLEKICEELSFQTKLDQCLDADPKFMDLFRKCSDIFYKDMQGDIKDLTIAIREKDIE